MKKKFWIILVAVIAIAIIWSAVKKNGDNKVEIVYETAPVEIADIINSITATGTIEPVTKVDVGTQVSGIVNKLYVDYNSIVTKGQVIAELDRTNLLSELSSCRNQLASAKSEYDYQTRNYQRMKELYEKELISENDYESALLDYERARNSYQVSQNNVSKAQTNLGYATIYSPIDGVVLSRSVEEGQTVAASYNTPTLCTIAADLTDMRLIADIDEADIGGVKEGQRVTFTVDAYPYDVFEGQVTQVRLEPTTTSNVVTYQVVISAPNPDLKLKPGLTANVSVYTMEAFQRLSIPAKALRYMPKELTIGKDDQIEDCEAPNKVWIKEEHLIKAYPVEAGVTNGSSVEILNGLNEGQEVILNSGPQEPLMMPEGNNSFSPFPQKR